MRNKLQRYSQGVTIYLHISERLSVPSISISRLFSNLWDYSCVNGNLFKGSPFHYVLLADKAGTSLDLFLVFRVLPILALFFKISFKMNFLLSVIKTVLLPLSWVELSFL